jgi:hypothetical protein
VLAIRAGERSSPTEPYNKPWSIRAHLGVFAGRWRMKSIINGPVFWTIRWNWTNPYRHIPCSMQLLSRCWWGWFGEIHRGYSTNHYPSGAAHIRFIGTSPVQCSCYHSVDEADSKKFIGIFNEPLPFLALHRSDCSYFSHNISPFLQAFSVCSTVCAL